MARNLDNLFDLMTTMAENHTESASHISEIRMKVGALEHGVRSLTDSLGGYSDEKLPTRMAILELQVKTIEQRQDKAASQRWQLILAMVGSMTALVAVLLKWVLP